MLNLTTSYWYWMENRKGKMDVCYIVKDRLGFKKNIFEAMS